VGRIDRRDAERHQQDSQDAAKNALGASAMNDEIPTEENEEQKPRQKCEYGRYD
jgi:hypothetical protein